MELHERLLTARPVIPIAGRDPFADVKNRIHLTVIGDLGPQLFNANIEPFAMRDRVTAEINNRLADEAGISKDDRDRIASEIADDILGHGPLERLLADDSVSEIMVNGPHEIWVERQGPLYATRGRFHAESDLRPSNKKIDAQAAPRTEEAPPMANARPPSG